MAYVDKIHSHAGRDLEAGEEIVGAARVLIKGGTAKLSVMPLGVIGAIMGADADAEGLEQGEAVDLELATSMAVALTNRRLLFYKRSSLNKLKELLGAVPRDSISRIEVTSEGLGKPTKITFADGNVLELEGVKVDPVEDLAIG